MPNRARRPLARGRKRTISVDKDFSSVGRKIDDVEVQFGTRLLKHFSEQLYASPNKAFEELISNSWDAGATVCHVGTSANLAEPDAMVMVLDNGVSMDRQGLHDLWKVAWSRKRDQAPVDEREPIGKFGIGKLATYALANKLTYVCKASDGVIRVVTMDYDEFEKKQPSSKKVAVTVWQPMREVTLAQVQEVLARSDVGAGIWDLIKQDLGSRSTSAKDSAFKCAITLYSVWLSNGTPSRPGPGEYLPVTCRPCDRGILRLRQLTPSI